MESLTVEIATKKLSFDGRIPFNHTQEAPPLSSLMNKGISSAFYQHGSDDVTHSCLLETPVTMGIST